MDSLSHSGPAQVNLSQSAKCEALVRVDEVETRERSLEHRERRLEEERNLMQGQVSLLQVTFHFLFPWTDFWMF